MIFKKINLKLTNIEGGKAYFNILLVSIQCFASLNKQLTVYLSSEVYRSKQKHHPQSTLRFTVDANNGSNHMLQRGAK